MLQMLEEADLVTSAIDEKLHGLRQELRERVIAVVRTNGVQRAKTEAGPRCCIDPLPLYNAGQSCQPWKSRDAR